MTKVNTMEMRNVEGGATYYARCSACGRQKKLGWNWVFLLGGWYMRNIYVPQENGKMTRQCRGYWSH